MSTHRVILTSPTPLLKSESTSVRIGSLKSRISQRKQQLHEALEGVLTLFFAKFPPNTEIKQY